MNNLEKYAYWGQSFLNMLREPTAGNGFGFGYLGNKFFGKPDKNKGSVSQGFGVGYTGSKLLNNIKGISNE